jgi:hypothetical protein
MSQIKANETLAIHIDEPNIIVIRSKTDKRLTGDELEDQARYLADEISRLANLKLQSSYNILAVMGKGKGYQLSTKALQVYLDVIEKLNVQKLAVIEEHSSLLKLFIRIASFSINSPEIKAFNSEKEATEWLHKAE